MTANLQLRSSPQPSRDPRRVPPAGGLRAGPRPRTSTRADRRSPGGASIEGSSAPILPPAVLSTAGRACDTTSDVLGCPRRIRRFRGRLRARLEIPHPHRLGSPGPSRTPSRQRQRLAPRQDAFHRRVLPPPSTHTALAGACGITRSPSPVSLLARWWLSPPRPGFRRDFAPEPTRLRGGRWARPMAFRPGPSAARRLLQPTRSASTAADRLIPVPGTKSGPACARALRSPESRRGRNLA